MIEYIKGILTELNPTAAVIEAAGVGYNIAITLPTYSALVGSEDKDVKLFITEVYRFLKRQIRWSGIPISFRIFHSLL